MVAIESLLSNGTSQHQRSRAIRRACEVEILLFVEHAHIQHVLVISIVNGSRNFMLQHI